MAPNEQGLMQRTFAWTGCGAALGGMLGVVSAGFTSTPPGETARAFVARSSMVSAGELAGIAAIFAASDTILTNINGHSAANGAVAGCLAGSLMGVRSGSIINAAYGCGAFAVLQGLGGLSFDMHGDSGH